MKSLKTWNEQRLSFLLQGASHQDYKLTVSLTKFERGLWRFYFNLWIPRLVWTNIGGIQYFPQKHCLVSYLWMCVAGCHQTDKDVASLLKPLRPLKKSIKTHFLLSVWQTENCRGFIVGMRTRYFTWWYVFILLRERNSAGNEMIPCYTELRSNVSLCL